MASTHDGKEVGSKAGPGKVDFKTANTYVGAGYGDAVPDDGHGQYVGEIDEAYSGQSCFFGEGDSGINGVYIVSRSYSQAANSLGRT